MSVLCDMMTRVWVKWKRCCSVVYFIDSILTEGVDETILRVGMSFTVRVMYRTPGIKLHDPSDGLRPPSVLAFVVVRAPTGNVSRTILGTFLSYV